MNRSPKGKRGRNTGDSETESGKKKRNNTREERGELTSSPQPSTSTSTAERNAPAQIGREEEATLRNQEKKGKRNQFILKAMEVLREIRRTGTKPDFLNAIESNKEGEGQESTNPSQSTIPKETGNEDLVSSGQLTTSSSVADETKEEQESSEEMNKAILAIIKAQKEFLRKLGLNLDQTRHLLKTIDPKEDNQHLIAELHQYTLHLAAVSKWCTCKDFILPYDWESYEKFCKAEEAIPPNRMREEDQMQELDIRPVSYAVADEILALFKQKLEENVQQIQEARKEREAGKGNSGNVQREEETMDTETTGQSDTRGKSKVQREVNQSKEKTIDASDGQSAENSNTSLMKYSPVKATSIWICSPSEEPLGSLVRKAVLVAQLNQAELEEEEEHKLVYSFPSQEKAMEVFKSLQSKIEMFTYENKIKPYLGLPSYQGKKGFKIRIENISIKELKEWWKMIHSEDEDFQSDFKANLVERNNKLLIEHDIRAIETWVTKPKGRGGMEKDHVAFVLVVGPMTFDKAKRNQMLGQLELMVWPTKDNYKKRIVKYEQMRKEEASLQAINHLPWDQIPTLKKRAWLSFYPHICNNCFDTGHSSEECEMEDPPSPRPCSKCKATGKKGSHLDHKTNSFSCKWYKNLSNRMEYAALKYQGGY